MKTVQIWDDIHLWLFILSGAAGLASYRDIPISRSSAANEYIDPMKISTLAPTILTPTLPTSEDIIRPLSWPELSFSTVSVHKSVAGFVLQIFDPQITHCHSLMKEVVDWLG